MLCAECRLFYKKYGIDRVIENRPETPAALRELRERLKPVEPVNQEVEMDFGLTNQDDSSQPAQLIPTEPELPVQPKTEVEPPPVKPEPKPDVKPEFKPEPVAIPVPNPVPAVVKDEPEEIKRKIPSENHEEEPQNKKTKHDPIAKQEPVVSVSYP